MSLLFLDLTDVLVSRRQACMGAGELVNMDKGFNRLSVSTTVTVSLSLWPQAGVGQASGGCRAQWVKQHKPHFTSSRANFLQGGFA